MTDRIAAAQPDERMGAILRGAFDAFLHYGFRRTSMQDIAEKSGMSRAALYLHFRNKEDIFRALLGQYYEAAAAAAAEALAAHDDPEAALKAAFAAQVGDAAEAMMTSPHGEELLSAKTQASRDIVAEGEARLAAIYADWLRRGEAEGRLSLAAFAGDAEALATTMMAALHGLKQVGSAWSTYLVARDNLAAMFGRALKA